MNDTAIATRAQAMLCEAQGDPDATFRAGQLETILDLVAHRRRVLLVQATGWGKSMVYWIAAKLLREQGSGPILIISPLLSLMRNQQEAASRLNLQTIRWNSELNAQDREMAREALEQNVVDIVFTTPEQLGPDRKAGLQQALGQRLGTIPLLVVDEVHCISEWGHDFRPDYQRIRDILLGLPGTIPLLGTTATATSRVVEDIQAQFGGSLQVRRGTLVRRGLKLGVIHLPGYADRLAWLSARLNKRPGSGIVYCLTQQDSNDVAAWLVSEGIDAAAYHGGLDTPVRLELEDRLIQNDIRVLVATTALGMGFDKPDLSFVIHFQRAKSLIEYYQQVGRAGRQLKSAHGIMLSGVEDEEIVTALIDSSVPRRADVERILRALELADEGLNKSELESAANLGRNKLDTALKHLLLRNPDGPAPVVISESMYRATGVDLAPERWAELEALSGLRIAEFQQVTHYCDAPGCLMAILQTALDDPHPAPCGECQVCLGKQSEAPVLDATTLLRATGFIGQLHVEIEPKMYWKGDDWPSLALIANKQIPKQLRHDPGLALCRYGRGHLGELVHDGKYRNGWFDPALIEAVATMLTTRGSDVLRQKPILTYVPSTTERPLVRDFAATVAQRVGLEFDPTLI